jgi:hypothetical protein
MGYELKALGEKLKAKGLDVAEDALIDVINETFDWVEEQAKANGHTVVQGLAPVVKPFLLDVADKVDGKEG